MRCGDTVGDVTTFDARGMQISGFEAACAELQDEGSFRFEGAGSQ